ncbi:uncharacterized protein [Littorina saxatilis]|uniref:Ras-associating domain-containing protein n=1 Tax=Littorina saxatilis TaxID=31220 RepID=A0AAN9G8Z4_9CAEN
MASDAWPEDIPIWIDSTQKWMTGLTRRTTCDDVIYALLYARGLLDTDSTDNYAVFERWRAVERPLQGRTKIVKVWSAWGVEQPNVQLLVQRLDDYFMPPEGARTRRRHRRANRQRDRHATHCRCAGRSPCAKCGRTRAVDQLSRHLVRQEQRLQDITRRVHDTDRQIALHEAKQHARRVQEDGRNYVQDSYLFHHGSHSDNSSCGSGGEDSLDSVLLAVGEGDLEAYLNLCEGLHDVDQRLQHAQHTQKALVQEIETEARSTENVDTFTGNLQGRSNPEHFLSGKSHTHVVDVNYQGHFHPGKGHKFNQIQTHQGHSAHPQDSSEDGGVGSDAQVEALHVKVTRAVAANVLQQQQELDVARELQLWEARARDRDRQIRQLQHQLDRCQGEEEELQKKRLFVTLPNAEGGQCVGGPWNVDSVNSICDGVGVNVDSVNSVCDGVGVNGDSVNSICDGVGVNDYENRQQAGPFVSWKSRADSSVTGDTENTPVDMEEMHAMDRRNSPQNCDFFVSDTKCVSSPRTSYSTVKLDSEGAEGFHNEYHPRSLDTGPVFPRLRSRSTDGGHRSKPPVPQPRSSNGSKSNLQLTGLKPRSSSDSGWQSKGVDSMVPQQVSGYPPELIKGSMLENSHPGGSDGVPELSQEHLLQQRPSGPQNSIENVDSVHRRHQLLMSSSSTFHRNLANDFPHSQAAYPSFPGQHLELYESSKDDSGVASSDSSTDSGMLLFDAAANTDTIGQGNRPAPVSSHPDSFLDVSVSYTGFDQISEENVSYDGFDKIGYAGDENLSYSGFDRVGYAGNKSVRYSDLDKGCYADDENMSYSAFDKVGYAGDGSVSYNGFDKTGENVSGGRGEHARSYEGDGYVTDGGCEAKQTGESNDVEESARYGEGDTTANPQHFFNHDSTSFFPRLPSSRHNAFSFEDCDSEQQTFSEQKFDRLPRDGFHHSFEMTAETHTYLNPKPVVPHMHRNNFAGSVVDTRNTSQCSETSDNFESQSLVLPKQEKNTDFLSSSSEDVQTWSDSNDLKEGTHHLNGITQLHSHSNFGARDTQIQKWSLPSQHNTFDRHTDSVTSGPHNTSDRLTDSVTYGPRGTHKWSESSEDFNDTVPIIVTDGQRPSHHPVSIISSGKHKGHRSDPAQSRAKTVRFAENMTSWAWCARYDDDDADSSDDTGLSSLPADDALETLV